MSSSTKPILSVADLFAEREAQRRKEREAAELLERKKQEELQEFRKRLDTFELTDDRVQAVLARVKRAFERGETELMITSFPSSFCSDDGRAITTAGVPSINKQEDAEVDQPAWLATVPKGVHVVYNYWKTNLRPGGFRLSARVINFPDGMPGDVGLFLSWPKSGLDE